MDRDVPTLESVWLAAAGSPITDTLLEWPPDVFALTEVILDHAEAYRFVVSPPPGAHWPPPRSRRLERDAVVDAAAGWTVSARDGDGQLPDLVADGWATVREAATTPIEAIAEGREWHVCAALLTLHAVADEACAGMGVSVEGSTRHGLRAARSGA